MLNFALAAGLDIWSALFLPLLLGSLDAQFWAAIAAHRTEVKGQGKTYIAQKTILVVSSHTAGVQQSE